MTAARPGLADQRTQVIRRHGVQPVRILQRPAPASRPRPVLPATRPWSIAGVVASSACSTHRSSGPATSSIAPITWPRRSVLLCARAAWAWVAPCSRYAHRQADPGDTLQRRRPAQCGPFRTRPAHRWRPKRPPPNAATRSTSSGRCSTLVIRPSCTCTRLAPWSPGSLMVAALQHAGKHDPRPLAEHHAGMDMSQRPVIVAGGG